MSTPDPTPTPLPAAPDWRALCADLLAQCDAGEMAPVEALEDIRAALATQPAPPPEPRGCPTPGACSCPTAPIVPPELIRALEMAEAALSDIGDADREPGDDIAWAERRAAQDLPRIRHALQAWRDHATPPAAPTPEAAAAMGAQGGPPSETERLAFEAWMRGHSWPVAGAWNGTTYIGSADLDPLCLVDTAAMQTRLLWAAWRDRAALATPPAATREAEHDDGDDAIDRWVDSKSDWISNWGAPRSDIAALIGEALEHWGRSTTREAGPLPQGAAEISDEEIDQLEASMWEPTGVHEQGQLEQIFNHRAFARAVLARWGGAAVPSKAAPTEEDLYDLAEAFNGDPVPAIRRALELWGGAAVPVPVSDGWPEFSDCDDSERVHCFNPVLGHWKLSKINPSIHTHWLPHWALPVPAAAAGEVEA